MSKLSGITTIILLALIAGLMTYPTILSSGKSGDIFGNVDGYLVAIPVPPENPIDIQATPPAWTTNNIDVPPWEGGWPVVTEFYPGDLLGYCTGPYFVEPGESWSDTMVIRNSVDGDPPRRDLVWEFGPLEGGENGTDWYIVYVIPRIPRLIRSPHSVDWTMDITGIDYHGSGSFSILIP